MKLKVYKKTQSYEAYLRWLDRETENHQKHIQGLEEERRRVEELKREEEESPSD